MSRDSASSAGSVRRRALLRAGAGLAGAAATAGCLSRLGFEARSIREPPLVEDRPDAVYIPSHIEGMEMAGMGDAGPYTCAVTYSFPHRFWVVTGTNRKMVEISSEDSVHLMVSLWDPETGIVPPTASTSIQVASEGETVIDRRPWPMLSQNMSFHFGDNVALSRGATYDVTVDVAPMNTRRTGGFRGRFGEPASLTIAFEFGRNALEGVSFERLDERKGKRGAVDPMETMTLARLPEEGELPGKLLGRATSGDGVFVVTHLDEPPAGIDASGSYLAVSARTPYNRYPLPFMSLSGRLSRGGEVAFEGPLRPTLDPDLDYHYGAVVDGIEAGDTLRLSVGAPPQVARHEGYETAFFEMDPMEITA